MTLKNCTEIKITYSPTWSGRNKSVWRQEKTTKQINKLPDSKVRVANMGPTWVLAAPGGPHVGPMNLAIRACIYLANIYGKVVHSKQWLDDSNSFSAIRHWILFDRVDLIMHYYWFDNGATLHRFRWSYGGSPVDGQRIAKRMIIKMTQNSMWRHNAE